MCGFLIYYSKSSPIKKDFFESALKSFNFRGPDFTSSIFFDHTNGMLNEANDEKPTVNLAVGHNRLSLVDLSENSNQPYLEAELGKVLCFNGELYNSVYYQNMASDTKFLYQFLVDGGNVSELQGMFSFALIDLKSKVISLHRDYYGKKPLYFYQDKERLIISSDLRAFQRLGVPMEFDLESVGEYMILKSCLDFKGGRTVWRNIWSVSPRENIVFDLQTGQQSSHKYNVSGRHSNPNPELFLNDFQHAVAKRFSVETKTAVTVSGGIDSSLNAIVAHNLGYEFDLYTVKLRGKGGNDDLVYSRKLSSDLGHKLYEVDHKDFSSHNTTGDSFLDLCIECVTASFSPLNLLNSTIPTYLYSKVMKDNGVKCYLDGVGADEVFGGYPAYDYLFRNNFRSGHLGDAFFHLKNSLLYGELTKYQKLLKLLKLAKFSFSPIEKNIHNNLTSEMCPSQLKLGIKSGISILNARNTGFTHKSFQISDIENYQLPMYLKIADNMSMANSIENRSPFLDEKFRNYIYLPKAQKHNYGKNKVILRGALDKLGYDYLTKRKIKSGNSSTFSLKSFESEKIIQFLEASSFIKKLSDLHPIDMPLILRARLLPIAILDQYVVSLKN
jgi:asparagine synthase (glutamine-hydrolysing)